MLLQVDGDVDAAIEFIIAGQETEESLVENNGVTCSDDDSHGNDRLVYLFICWLDVFGSSEQYY